MNKRDKILSARARLRERFEARMQATPGLSDTAAQGTGPANRHGMPKLPPGQSASKKWPVLDLGVQPEIAKQDWRLELKGLCKATTLDFDALAGFEQIEEASDFHCVTTWSQMDLVFRGVRLVDVIASTEIHEEASHIMCYGYDGYSTNLSLAEALKPDVLLTYAVNGEPLSLEHGGPVRMITPQLYAWKGAKWISAIEFMAADHPGFWEKNGYSMTAHPWREDRYS